MDAELQLGIDFGTSNTVAVFRRPGANAGGDAAVLTFDGAKRLPSAVYVPPGAPQPLVGKEAIESGQSDPGRFEPHPKARIKEEVVLLDDREWPVVELIAAVLRRVRVTAETVVGATIDRVVLTYPEQWASRTRRALRDAAAAAGWRDVDLVLEPVAAATFLARNYPQSPGREVLVCDFGGGTFDTAVVRHDATGPSVTRSGGSVDLGGRDIDQRIADRVVDALPSDAQTRWRAIQRSVIPADHALHRQLRHSAEMAKITLSSAPAAIVGLPDTTAHDHLLNRDEFNGWIGDLIDMAVERAKAILDAPPHAQIDGVLLIGGSSQIPLLHQRLHQRLGVPPQVPEAPDTVVALGCLDAPPVPEFPGEYQEAANELTAQLQDDRLVDASALRLLTRLAERPEVLDLVDPALIARWTHALPLEELPHAIVATALAPSTLAGTPPESRPLVRGFAAAAFERGAQPIRARGRPAAPVELVWLRSLPRGRWQLGQHVLTVMTVRGTPAVLTATSNEVHAWTITAGRPMVRQRSELQSVLLDSDNLGAKPTAIGTVPMAGRELLAIGCRDGSLHLFDPAADEGSRLQTLHRSEFSTEDPVLQLSPIAGADGAVWLAARSAARIGVWNPATRRLRVKVPAAKDDAFVSALAVVPTKNTGQCLVAAGADGRLCALLPNVRREGWAQRLSAAVTDTHFITAPPPAPRKDSPFSQFRAVTTMTPLSSTSAGSRIAVGRWAGTLSLIDGRTTEVILPGFRCSHDGPVTALAAVTTGGGRPLVASAGVDRTLRLWDPQDGAPVWTLRLPRHHVINLLGDGDILAVATHAETGVLRLADEL